MGLVVDVTLALRGHSDPDRGREVACRSLTRDYFSSHRRARVASNMGGTSTVRVRDQFCFAVYSAANAVVRTYRPLLRDLGLTYPQYLVLMVLWEDDALSVRQVADRLQLPANALTPRLERLERLGLLGLLAFTIPRTVGSCVRG